jgi:SHOCT-like domain
MENIVLETSANPIIEINNVGGDLRITGWDQSQLVAESGDEDGVHFDRDGDRLRLQSDSDCSLRLPHGAQVSVRTVGGDATVKFLEQQLAIGNVGGDLTLRQVAGANIGVVGGDMKVKRVMGDVQVGHVGGDLEAREVDGAFKSGNVGGDLYLQAVRGSVQAIAGGDVTLSLNFAPEQEYSVQAGSDLSCRVGPGASARLELIAGGDISLGVPAAQVVGNSNHKTVTLGAGAAAVNLRAGGDLRLTGASLEADFMGDFDEKFGEDFASMADEFQAQIGSHIEAQMADFEKQMNERMAGLNFTASPVDAAKIAASARRAAERMQRAGRQQAESARRQAEKEAERARRIAEAAQRRAEAINRKVHEEHGRRGWPFRGEPPRQPSPPRQPPPPAPQTDAISDEERMTILRMVEQKKISVAEAEKLLAALENK